MKGQFHKSHIHVHMNAHLIRAEIRVQKDIYIRSTKQAKKDNIKKHIYKKKERQFHKKLYRYTYVRISHTCTQTGT